MVEAIVDSLAGIPVELRVFFLAMLPITELRGAIPLGVAWGLTPYCAFLWSLAGNFVPIIPLLLGLRWFLHTLVRHPFFAKPLHRLAMHGRRSQDKVRRYGWVGLTLIVALPLPGTGVWTGCLIAALLGLRLLPSVAAITIGEIIAGILVVLITSSVLAVSRLMCGEIILLFLFVVAGGFYFWYHRSR